MVLEAHCQCEDRTCCASPRNLWLARGHFPGHPTEEALRCSERHRSWRSLPQADGRAVVVEAASSLERWDSAVEEEVCSSCRLSGWAGAATWEVEEGLGRAETRLLVDFGTCWAVVAAAAEGTMYVGRAVTASKADRDSSPAKSERNGASTGSRSSRSLS